MISQREHMPATLSVSLLSILSSRLSEIRRFSEDGVKICEGRGPLEEDAQEIAARKLANVWRRAARSSTTA